MTRSDYTYAADSQLFQRNPVCGVCWRICMDMCEEWGGQINFDLLASMEVADRLCRRLINNTWTLCGIEYYYHWLESELGYSRPAITCATATVCLTLQLMEDAPQPLLQLGADMHGITLKRTDRIIRWFYEEAKKRRKYIFLEKFSPLKEHITDF